MAKRTDRGNNEAKLTRLGKRICKLRLEKGWSQQDLARRSGIHAHHLGKIERGEANATLGTLVLIAKSLKITISKLFQGIS